MTQQMQQREKVARMRQRPTDFTAQAKAALRRMDKATLMDIVRTAKIPPTKANLNRLWRLLNASADFTRVSGTRLYRVKAQRKTA